MVRTSRKFDYPTIKKLASIGCYDREIAAVIDVAPETFCRRKKTDRALVDAIETGRESGKASLRRMQWQKASEGNATMQIWLGKQILSQRDRVEHAEVSAVSDEIRPDELTDAQLKQIVAEELAKANAQTPKARTGK